MFGQESSHQLVTFLTAVSREQDAAVAMATAAELAAEEFDAEVGAVFVSDALGATVGFGTGGIPERDLAALALGAGEAELTGVGHCHIATATWDKSPGRLIVGRLAEPFAPEERTLLLGMARGLGLALKMIKALETERTLRAEHQRQAEERLDLLASLEARRRLLEVLLDIQRSISHRAPLPAVLEEVIAGASSLLGGCPVSLLLDDALDPGRPIVASTTAVAVDPAAASDPDVSARVHINGEPVGALVASPSNGPFGTAEHALLAAFAEHASLALTDARTVEAMEEAFHDPLTGLPNRALFINRLEHALEVRRRHDDGIAVLFVDLDRFKAVNDTLGHAAGDELLRAVSKRLAKCTRASDTAARFGGDEFAVLIEDRDSGAPPEDVAQRIISAIRRPFHLGGKEVFVGATIGIAQVDSSSPDAEALLHNADLAMYRAKKDGGNRWVTFRPAMRTALLERVGLETDLQRALERRELSVHYQPLHRLDTGEPIGVEALVRWTHPVRGHVPPSTFIPIAEEIGIVGRIGRWVLRKACRELASWRALAPELTLSVNLSAHQLRDAALSHYVEQALHDAGLPGDALTLEITESMIVDDDGDTAERLDALKRLGVTIAIDDFGTGYSSLGALQRLPVDILKVDKSFVDQLGASPDETAIVRTIIALGHNMRLRMIAEGIETADQLEQLRDLHCDVGQGYHFSRPMCPEELVAYLERAGAKGVRANAA